MDLKIYKLTDNAQIAKRIIKNVLAKHNATNVPATFSSDFTYEWYNNDTHTIAVNWTTNTITTLKRLK